MGQASVVQQNLDRKWANHRKCPPRHKIQMKYARQRGKWRKEADPDDPLVWTTMENSEATGGSLRRSEMTSALAKHSVTQS